MRNGFSFKMVRTDEMNTEQLTRRIKVADKEIPADIVIKNGKVLDVFNLEWLEEDVAIVDGVIAGLGSYEGKEELDAKGKMIIPGLIDAHVHIESSMVTPKEFEKVVLPHGVTTVITDPHEIANVAGEEGISFMLKESEEISLNAFFMLPSSVPATPFEHSGAELFDADLRPFYQHSRVLGLAEVMDYPGVKNADPNILHKLMSAAEYNIDGHGAGLDTHGVNIYAAAGIQTDHECTTVKQAKERLSRGMKVMLRQGSVAKNLVDLLPVVNERNSQHVMFCTDDKHLDDLIEEGSIDFNIRLAMEEGLDPLLAIQMGTLNAAQTFGLKQKGAIAPGYDADFLIIDDLKTMQSEQVYVAGKQVAENGEFIGQTTEETVSNERVMHSITLPQITDKQLALEVPEEKEVPVIEIIPNQIETIKCMSTVPTEEGQFIPSTTDDLLKIAVIERHHGTGNIGLGIVKGLGLTNGAIATTIAHDSHNLIVAGTNDREMMTAIQAIESLGGGIVVVRENEVLGSLQLDIGGLMSAKSYQVVADEIAELHQALGKISKYDHFNQFLTLSFLSLPVIPELKITDMGLFDVTEFKHISYKE